MKSKKLIAGLTIGAIAAVILIPKTRKMIYSAACSLTDALKGIADNAIDAAEKGGNQLDKLSNKAVDIASSVKEAKHSWQ